MIPIGIVLISLLSYFYPQGRVIFCSGSPFPPVVYNGKRHITGQANNALVFPGIALGAICFFAKTLPSEIYLDVAHTLAQFTTDEQLKDGILYPPMANVEKVSTAVAKAIGCYLIKHGEQGAAIYSFFSSHLLCHFADLSHLPLTSDMMDELLQRFVYKYYYYPAMSNVWEYPEADKKC